VISDATVARPSRTPLQSACRAPSPAIAARVRRPEKIVCRDAGFVLEPKNGSDNEPDSGDVGLGKLLGLAEVDMATTAKLFRRILVPHDFSPPADEALAVAADLAARHGGSLVVLHVLTPFYSGAGYPTQAEIAWTPPDQIAADRRDRLERLVRARLGRSGPEAVCKVVTGEAAPEILAAAKSADSIVMATLGRTGLSHFLLGSVAEKVVRHAPIPVMTVRPRLTPRRKEQPTRARRARR
jgi:nucleotide-binding universal stress UspA family protein